MKRIMARLLLAALGTTAACAQTVIDALETHGRMSWSEPVMIGFPPVFHVEWAPQAGGPWHRGFANQGTIDANGQTNWSVEIPRFFRVVRATNAPPPGMVWIEGGDFLMGDTYGIHASATPVHTNWIDGFWMDGTEVTLAHWDEVRSWATNNGYGFSNAGTAKGPTHPVTELNWFDAVKWCNARSQWEGRAPVYMVGLGVYQTGEFTNAWMNAAADGYRLPTEAEWEKAARGGRRNKLFPWGENTISHSQANYYSDWDGGTNVFYPYDVSPTSGSHPYTAEPEPRTLPVRSFAPNGYGLFDMSGNVLEWCWDWSAANYEPGNKTNPAGPVDGTSKILRGGGWRAGPVGQPNVRGLTVTARSSIGPAEENHTIGFRCVRQPD